MSDTESFEIGLGTGERGVGRRGIMLQHALAAQQFAARGIERTPQGGPRVAGVLQIARAVRESRGDAPSFDGGRVTDGLMHTLGEL